MIGSTEKIERLKPFRFSLALNIILLLLILTHSTIRDIYLEKQYTGDLRNRIVGARLQKDGRLPYFYYWQTQDGIRYFDPINNNRSAEHVSPITASPFFHQLLYPICNLDQQTLSKTWLAFQYILLAAMIWIACRITTDRSIQWLIINTGVLFTLTEAWKSIIVNGQIYLFYAFLMLCIISFLLPNKKKGSVIAGLIMAVWILNRPIGLIAILPILFLYKQQRIVLFSTCTGLFLYGLFILSSSFEKSLWKNYLEAMRIQVQLHQGADPKATLAPYILPPNRQLEGIDFNEVDKNMIEHPITVYSENGNFFVLFQQLTHKKIPLTLLNLLLGFTITVLMAFFYSVFKKNNLNLLQILIFAFTLYMIVEIFSPVYRHQYNAIQWLPLIMAALWIPMQWNNPIFLLLAMGLLLNIVNPGWIPMRHTLGELAWLVALLWISFSKIKKNPAFIPESAKAQ